MSGKVYILRPQDTIARLQILQSDPYPAKSSAEAQSTLPTDALVFEEIDLEQAQGYEHRTAVELSLRLQRSLQGAGPFKSSDVFQVDTTSAKTGVLVTPAATVCLVQSSPPACLHITPQTSCNNDSASGLLGSGGASYTFYAHLQSANIPQDQLAGVWLATASCPDNPRVLAACLRHAYGGRLWWNSPLQCAFWVALLHSGWSLFRATVKGREELHAIGYKFSPQATDRLAMGTADNETAAMAWRDKGTGAAELRAEVDALRQQLVDLLHRLRAEAPDVPSPGCSPVAALPPQVYQWNNPENCQPLLCTVKHPCLLTAPASPPPLRSILGSAVGGCAQPWTAPDYSAPAEAVDDRSSHSAEADSRHRQKDCGEAASAAHIAGWAALVSEEDEEVVEEELATTPLQDCNRAVVKAVSSIVLPMDIQGLLDSLAAPQEGSIDVAVQPREFDQPADRGGRAAVETLPREESCKPVSTPELETDGAQHSGRKDGSAAAHRVDEQSSECSLSSASDEEEDRQLQKLEVKYGLARRPEDACAECHRFMADGFASPESSTAAHGYWLVSSEGHKKARSITSKSRETRRQYF